MKLQKQLSRKVANKEYIKWVIVIPSEIIDKLQWADGDHLTPSVEGRILSIRKVRK